MRSATEPGDDATPSLRKYVLYAAAACVAAGFSFLWCDPAAPDSLLVHENKQRIRDDPDRVRRAIEEYDYKLANPWGLTRTDEELEQARRQRRAFVRRLEELESR